METEPQANIMELLHATVAKDFSGGVFERSMHTAAGFRATARWTKTSGTSAAIAV